MAGWTNIYKVNDTVYYRINGKDFYVIYSFGKWHEIYYLMVAGPTPLKKEDLPDKTFAFYRVPRSQVFVVWNKNVMPSERVENIYKKFFLGANTVGSYFLALKWIGEYTRQIYPDADLYQLARAVAPNGTLEEAVSGHWKYNNLIQLIKNDGNIEDADAVMIDVNYMGNTANIVTQLMRKLKGES